MSLVVVKSLKEKPKKTVKHRDRYVNNEGSMFRVEGYTRLLRKEYRTKAGRRLNTGNLISTYRQILTIGNEQYKELNEEAFSKALVEEQGYIRVKCNNGLIASRTTFDGKTISNHLIKLEALGYIIKKENPISVHKYNQYIKALEEGKKVKKPISRTDDFTLFLPKSLVVCEFSNDHNTSIEKVYAQTERVTSKEYNNICEKVRSGKSGIEVNKKPSNESFDNVGLSIIKAIDLISLTGGVTTEAQKQLVNIVVNIVNSAKKTTIDNQLVTSSNKKQLQQVPYLKEKGLYNNNNGCGKLNKVLAKPTLESNSFAEENSEKKRSEVSISSFLNILTKKGENTEKDFAAERERQIKALEKAGLLKVHGTGTQENQDISLQQKEEVEPQKETDKQEDTLGRKVELVAESKNSITQVEKPYNPYFLNLNLHKIQAEGRKLPELQFFAQALWRKSNRLLWKNKVWVKPYVDTSVEFMKLHLIARKEEVEREHEVKLEEWESKYMILKATDRRIYNNKRLKFVKELPNSLRMAYRRLNRAIDKAYEHGQKKNYTKFYPPLTGKLPYLELYAKVGLWNATDWAISEEKSFEGKKEKDLNDFLNHQKSLITVSSYEYATLLRFRKEGLNSALHYQQQLLHKLTTLDCVQALDRTKQTEIIEKFKNTRILWQV